MPSARAPRQTARPETLPRAPTRALQVFHIQGGGDTFLDHPMRANVGVPVRAIRPRRVRPQADCCVRRGIRSFVTVEHHQTGWKPLPRVVLTAA